MNNSKLTDALDAFIFAEFIFADEIEIEKLYKKYHFEKEFVIDNSLERLAKRDYLYSENSKWRLTEKGANRVKELKS